MVIISTRTMALVRLTRAVPRRIRLVPRVRALSRHVPATPRQIRSLSTMSSLLIGASAAFGTAVTSGFRIVRPNQLGLVERLGQYTHTAKPGLRVIWPFGIGSMEAIQMDMQKVEIDEQWIITKEQLNIKVRAIVYYKVEDPYKARYNVDNYADTVPTLAQTTLRDVLGGLTLVEANSERKKINQKLKAELTEQTKEWGMDIISVELQQIEPTERVQHSMNDIVIAEQKKIAATNTAHALEIEADGKRRAQVKEAEGEAQTITLNATAQAEAVRLAAQAQADALQWEFEAADKYFKGNATLYRQLQATESSLKNNSLVVLGQPGQTMNLLDLAKMRPESSSIWRPPE